MDALLLAGMKVIRSPLMPDHLLIGPDGWDMHLLPPLPLVAIPDIADPFRWRMSPPPVVTPRFRSIDLMGLMESVWSGRSPDRVWADDWWHHGERRGWWD